MGLCLVHTELQTLLVTVRVSRGVSPPGRTTDTGPGVQPGPGVWSLFRMGGL